MKKYESQVNSGCLFLDKIYPNWYREINLYKLDMSNRYCCILGQLYKEYGKGLEILGYQEFYGAKEEDNNAFQFIHGFSLLPSSSLMDNLELTEEWEKQITKRIDGE